MCLALVDKHSTGGVGADLADPRSTRALRDRANDAGRGLGHTGGTLDKPKRFRPRQPRRNELRQALQKVGVGMIGQTPRAADRSSIRCGTSLEPWRHSAITASILSKKLVEGIDAPWSWT